MSVVGYYRWPLAAKAQGVVTGVIYTIENSSALVDGCIVKEGDSIHGVKIESIGQLYVEFSKNGKTWKQRVNESPDPGWRETVEVKTQ